MAKFSGLGLHMGNLSLLSDAETRSISPENFTGEKGKGGMSTDGPAANAARGLGQGWKVSPYILIDPGQTFTLADITGEGAIQQVWMTLARGRWRHTILRVYWDDQEQPSIECPAGDFDFDLLTNVLLGNEVLQCVERGHLGIAETDHNVLGQQACFVRRTASSDGGDLAGSVQAGHPAHAKERSTAAVDLDAS